MIKFSYQEKRILNTLYNASRPLTTAKVAERSELSWITAQKYLAKLAGRGYVEHKKKGKAIYWRIARGK